MNLKALRVACQDEEVMAFVRVNETFNSKLPPTAVGLVLSLAVRVIRRMNPPHRRCYNCLAARLPNQLPSCRVSSNQ